jgi:hypothetical protein
MADHTWFRWHRADRRTHVKVAPPPVNSVIEYTLDIAAQPLANGFPAQPNPGYRINDLGALDGIDWALAQRWKGVVPNLLKHLTAVIAIRDAPAGVFVEPFCCHLRKGWCRDLRRNTFAGYQLCQCNWVQRDR